MRFAGRLALFGLFLFVATCPLALAVVRDWGRDRLVPLRTDLVRTARVLARAVDPAFLRETRRPLTVLPRVYWPLRRFEVERRGRPGFSQAALDRSCPVARGRIDTSLECRAALPGNGLTTVTP